LILNDVWGKALRVLLPMPVFETPFLLSMFIQAAVLGFVLPFVATLYPVWRAVRVAPVDAIKTGYLVAKGGGLAPAMARIPLPGRSFTQMPIRNVLRSPRRSILTLLGIAVAITLLIAMQGILDSMLITINQGKVEFLQNTPQRMTVNLDFFYPVQWSTVEAIRTSPTVAAAEPGIQVGGYLAHNGIRLETFLDLINLDSAMWRPTITAGSLHSDKPGVILAEKAAQDLGVKPGDKITLSHPRREGLLSFRLVDTEVEVVGTHALPLRFMTYMDINQANLMGLQGLTNIVQVVPAAGASRSDVQRALFDQAGIASVQPVSALVEVFENLMEMFIVFFSIAAAAVMVLAFLIAFNSTSISVDERAREIATMFAFGVRVRTVTRMTMLENLITGVLGTLLGIGLGYVVLVWMLTDRMAAQMPDISLTIALTPATLALAVILGVLVVALTPLLNMRKMLRMDVPSTLRVME
jgi:putative ABC transport system permease protein